MSTAINFSLARTRLLWSIFIAACFLNTTYVRFGTDNQMEPLPMIYRAMNPHYLVKDWFTNTNDRLNHRTGFIKLVVTLSRLVGLRNTYALLTAIGVWLAVWGTLELCTLLWEEKLPLRYQALEYLFAAGLALKLAWGALGIPAGFGLSLDPTLLSFPLTLFATTFLLRGQFWAAGATFLAAGIMHPLAAPEIMLLVVIAWWFQLSKSQRQGKWWVGPALLIVGSLPLLTLIPFTLSKEVTAEQARRATEILVLIRAPHHYAPFTWGLSAWLQFGMSLVFIALLRTQTGPARFLYGFMATAVLFALCGCLPFLLGAGLSLTKLQTFRMTSLLPFLLAFAFARFMSKLALNSPRDAALAVAMGGALLLNRYRGFAPPRHTDFLISPAVWVLAFGAFLALRKYWPKAPTALQWLVLWPWWLAYLYSNLRTNPKPYLPMVLALILFGVWLTTKGKKNGEKDGEAIEINQSKIPGALVLGSFLLLCFYAAAMRSNWGIAWDMPPERRLYAWAQTHSPPQAVFMTPPSMVRFRLGANRAVVVDTKCIPFRDIAILQWHDRVTSLNSALATYPSDPAPWRTLARRFGADFIVLPAGKTLSTTPAYQDANYSVYSVKP